MLSIESEEFPAEKGAKTRRVHRLLAEKKSLVDVPRGAIKLDIYCGIPPSTIR